MLKNCKGLTDSTTMLIISVVIAYLIGGGQAVTNLYNVVDFGAKGDGTTDDTPAFLRAWDAACAQSTEPSDLLVPELKVFLLNHVVFKGPCRNQIRVAIDGSVRAPSQPWTGEGNFWLSFQYVEGLLLDGKGEIDGRGQAWWNCKINKQCTTVPNALYIFGCDNFKISGLKFKDSPGKQISIDAVSGGQIFGISITAPGDSPNTDGIYLQRVQNLQISDSYIGTGDDCIAIGTNSSYINITNIACGPGHGISIGSLGGDDSEARVEQIHVSNCELKGTMTGVRIKTWQGGYGYARDISFKYIQFTDVNAPIIIDQYYCNGAHNCPNKTQAVQVSNVHYAHLNGTTDQDFGIALECSQTSPCTGIILEDIDIRPSAQNMPKNYQGSTCISANGKKIEPITPTVSCLS